VTVAFEDMVSDGTRDGSDEAPDETEADFVFCFFFACFFWDFFGAISVEGFTFFEVAGIVSFVFTESEPEGGAVEAL
jgi:hypothetical protein